MASLKNRMRDLCNRWLRRSGFELVRYTPSVSDPRWRMQGMLDRLQERGIEPNTFIDLGAAAGEWAAAAKNVFPEARAVLVEPLDEQIGKLRQTCRDWTDSVIVKAAAGDHSGSVAISVSEDLDSSGVYSDADDPSSRTVPMSTIDQIVGEHDLCDPFPRPGDSLLWQMDLLFLRDTDPVFKRQGFR